MSPHPYGPIPTARSEFFALLHEHQREYARLNALASAATLLTDVITALELHLDASDNATVDLAGAIAHSHASPRSLRRWVAEGVVKKHGDRYVVSTLPVLTAHARTAKNKAARPAGRDTTPPAQKAAAVRARSAPAYNPAEAAEQFRATIGTTAARARRKERK